MGEVHPGPPGPTTSPRPGPAGLLLSRDLIFTTKVTGTARALGHSVLTAGTPDLALAMIEQGRPRVVFVDLAGGDLASTEALSAYRRSVGDGAALVAFGSHVETDRLAAARAAGCDAVLVRSQFSAQLPDLIRRYLGTPSEGPAEPASGPGQDASGEPPVCPGSAVGRPSPAAPTWPSGLHPSSHALVRLNAPKITNSRGRSKAAGTAVGVVASVPP